MAKGVVVWETSVLVWPRRVDGVPFRRVDWEVLNGVGASKDLKACGILYSIADEGLSEDREGSSSDSKELERIREKRLAELMEKRDEVSSEPVHVTDSNFKELVGRNRLAVVDFWAAWCGPCQALAPTIGELAKEYAGRVLVGKLNVDENPETAECFQVFSIPTMLIMKNGEEVERIVGCVQKKYIEAALRKHLE